MKQFPIFILSISFIFSSFGSVAQEFPSKPIRLILPFATGGIVDPMSRAVTQKVTESIGQPFVIEHRPGSGGVIAADYARKQAPGKRLETPPRTALASPHMTDGQESAPAWFCVRSQIKHEHIAAQHLRKLPGVEVFCPRVRFQRATRRGKVWFTEAMFPNYLFARFELSFIRAIKAEPGVASVVHFGPHFATVPDEIIADLRERLDMGILFVTHDLGVLARLADTITIMRHGRVVEQSDALSLFDAPREPYTRQLLEAARRLELGAGKAP